MKNEIFQRAELLLGGERLEQLAHQRVIIFGVGGVGSWCAEGLVRSGIHHLTIVDSDVVAASNINRQLMATTLTIGLPKVEVLKERLLTINPAAEITAIQRVFCQETAADFHLADYDIIIDAIDSLKDKALLIEQACETAARLFSSMGAAMKLDTTCVQVAEFWKVKGDPLARALRNFFKKEKRFPKRKFLCVFSDEPPLVTRQQGQPCGSMVPVTAVFGFTLASLALRDEK